MSTNNARIERIDSAWTFRHAWQRGQRCLIPALNFDEPNWESGKNQWWTLAPAEAPMWMLAGIHGRPWVDPQTGEAVEHYTMITQNCDNHPLLSRLHKPDPKLPANKQDKRTLVPIAMEDWQTWLEGSLEDAMSLIRVWPESAFNAGPREDILARG